MRIVDDMSVMQYGHGVVVDGPMRMLHKCGVVAVVLDGHSWTCEDLCREEGGDE